MSYLLSTASLEAHYLNAAEGAFGSHPGHDAHIHQTLSGIQILVMQDALDRVDKERVAKCASTR